MFFSWDKDSSCESIWLRYWVEKFSHIFNPHVHPQPTHTHNGERLFMTVKTSFYSIHAFSIHFLFPLDMCTHFPHIFHSASLFEFFLSARLLLLLPTIEFLVLCFYLMLFVYLLRAFLLWRQREKLFASFFIEFLIFFIFFFFPSQLFYLRRRNLSGSSTPSGMQTPRKGSVEPQSRSSRGTTPLDKREPFKL